MILKKNIFNQIKLFNFNILYRYIENEEISGIMFIKLDKYSFLRFFEVPKCSMKVVPHIMEHPVNANYNNIAHIM